jgi:simple sugar transport system permease protein
MALAAAIPLRAGVVNLGGDGQLLVGALVGAIVALYLPAPGVVRIAVAIAAAMAAGGAYASVAALLQTALGIPFLIASLLLSYIAVGITSYVVRFPLRDPTSGLPETRRILAEARLPVSIFGLPISAGFVLMALVALAVVINDRRGVIGFDMRMRGFNANFARYTGVALPRQTVALAFVSGAIAGLVGAILILGVQYRFTDGSLLVANYTWSGLLAAILAAGNPLVAIIAAAFFAALQVGGFSMERSLGLPSVLTQILQALIILCLAMRGGITRRQ